MSNAMADYVRRTANMEWLPLIETGIETRGIFVKPLNADPNSGRPISFLLKFQPGTSYPHHKHPKGEEILVLDGSCRIEDEVLRQGDYLYTPSGFGHAVFSEERCIMFLMVPAEVEIQERGQG